MLGTGNEDSAYKLGSSQSLPTKKKFILPIYRGAIVVTVLLFLN